MDNLQDAGIFNFVETPKISEDAKRIQSGETVVAIAFGAPQIWQKGGVHRSNVHGENIAPNIIKPVVYEILSTPFRKKRAQGD